MEEAVDGFDLVGVNIAKLLQGVFRYYKMMLIRTVTFPLFASCWNGKKRKTDLSGKFCIDAD